MWWSHFSNKKCFLIYLEMEQPTLKFHDPHHISLQTLQHLGEQNYTTNYIFSVLKTGRLMSVIRDRTVKRGLGVTSHCKPISLPNKQAITSWFVPWNRLLSMNYPMLHPFFNCCSNEWFFPLESSNYDFFFTLEVLYVDKLDYYVEEVVLRIVVRSKIHVPCRSEYVVVETTVRGRRDGRVGKYCGWLANDRCSPCEIHAHMLVFSEVYLRFCILLNKLNIWNQQKQTHEDWWLFHDEAEKRDLTKHWLHAFDDHHPTLLFSKFIHRFS